MDEVHQHRLVSVRGAPPSLIDMPKGCRFAARCDFEIDLCRQALPILKVNEGKAPQAVACHRAAELDLELKVPQEAKS
jgi:oligopeptide/dipeptide ABC transporter ATP-binding protein